MSENKVDVLALLNCYSVYVRAALSKVRANGEKAKLKAIRNGSDPGSHPENAIPAYRALYILDEGDKARAAVAELIEAHKALCRHFVNTLESGRDRIIALGGDCDPVDRMEQSDPVLARSRAALARVGGAS